MIDLSDALSAFAVPGGITVRRRSPGTTVDGRYTEGAVEETEGVEATVQPAGTEDLEMLPEGLRTSKSITVWSAFEFATAEQGAVPDQVVYRGEVFDVHAVRDWDIVGGYRKAVAVRVG